MLSSLLFILMNFSPIILNGSCHWKEANSMYMYITRIMIISDSHVYVVCYHQKIILVERPSNILTRKHAHPWCTLYVHLKNRHFLIILFRGLSCYFVNTFPCQPIFSMFTLHFKWGGWPKKWCQKPQKDCQGDEG